MQRLWFESYIAMISNSVGTEMFKNFYIEKEGNKKDVFNNGELSCAYYVSSVLTLFGQNNKSHATVESTIKDLEEHKWQKLKPKTKLEVGDVIIWEDMEFADEPGVLHPHIGFYLGNKKAISNNYKIGSPQKHLVESLDRPIKTIYRGKHLFAKLPQPS